LYSSTVCVIFASALQLHLGRGRIWPWQKSLGIWDSRQSSINKSPNFPDYDWSEQKSIMRIDRNMLYLKSLKICNSKKISKKITWRHSYWTCSTKLPLFWSKLWIYNWIWTSYLVICISNSIVNVFIPFLFFSRFDLTVFCV
jgi:hypothetical protein